MSLQTEHELEPTQSEDTISREPALISHRDCLMMVLRGGGEDMNEEGEDEEAEPDVSEKAWVLDYVCLSFVDYEKEELKSRQLAEHAHGGHAKEQKDFPACQIADGPLVAHEDTAFMCCIWVFPAHLKSRIIRRARRVWYMLF